MSQWRTERDPWFGCDLWRGAVNGSGYPTIWCDGRPRQAYYVALERAGIQVPPGHAIDHLCRRRLCCAPAHLEVVTQAENSRRVSWAYRSQLVTCPKGHDLHDHGRRTAEGGTVCRICSGVATARRGKEPQLR